MSSTFIKVEKTASSRKKAFQDGRPSQIYLQFVPGQCLYSTLNGRDTNTIVAIPHQGGDTLKFGPGMGKSYKPLLRGIVETPVKGDPVLLCTFQGINYYLGPLNTQNNPNFNTDPQAKGFFGLTSDDIDSTTAAGKQLKKSETVSGNHSKGESNYFPKHPRTRLQKSRIQYLDKLPEQEDTTQPDYYKYAGEIHGDLVLEGRFGNSIRIGSRHKDPLLFISNGRNPRAQTESSLDSSIITMTTNGSLWQHFPNTVELVGEEPDETDMSNFEVKPFLLSSDTTEDGTPSADLISFVNDDGDINELYYENENPQMFINSDKITFNSRLDSIYMSSFQNIHIGASKSVTISSLKETILQSPNIYLGKLSAEADEDKREGLVLGEQLRAYLEELINILIKIQTPVMGAPTPHLQIPDLTKLLMKIQKPGDTPFLSTKHYIEEN